MGEDVEVGGSPRNTSKLEPARPASSGGAGRPPADDGLATAGVPRPRRKPYRKACDVAEAMQTLIDGEADGFGPGALLPTVTALARRFDVARRTAREAVWMVWKIGLIVPTLDGARVIRVPPGVRKIPAAAIAAKERLPNAPEVLGWLRRSLCEAAFQAATGVMHRPGEAAAFNDACELAIAELHQAGPRTAQDLYAAVYASLLDLCTDGADHLVYGSFKIYMLSRIGMSLELLFMHEWFREQVASDVRALRAMIRAHDPQGARDAASRHMSYVSEEYFRARQTSERSW